MLLVHFLAKDAPLLLPWIWHDIWCFESTLDLEQDLFATSC